MDIIALKPVWSIVEILFGRGKKVTPEVAGSRLKVCLECEHLIAESRRCKKCKCYMEIKTE